MLKCNYYRGNKNVKALQTKLLNAFWTDKSISEVLSGKGLREDIADSGDILRAIIGELGMPNTLKDVDVGREQVDDLASNSRSDTWLQTNAVPLTMKDQVLEILEMIIE